MYTKHAPAIQLVVQRGKATGHNRSGWLVRATSTFVPAASGTCPADIWKYLRHHLEDNAMYIVSWHKAASIVIDALCQAELAIKPRTKQVDVWNVLLQGGVSFPFHVGCTLARAATVTIVCE